MARKPNTQLGEDAAIISSFSIRRSLKDKLPVIALKLGLTGVSEMFQLLALYPEEAQQALKPLADKLLAQQAIEKTQKAAKVDALEKLKGLSPEQLQALVTSHFATSAQ